MRVNHLLWGVMLMVSLSAGSAEVPPLTHGLTAIPAAPAAPELRLPNMDEEIVDLADYRGKVVVVNFWATWCPPCRREMSSLERLYQTAGERGVVVLAVNLAEDIDTVFSFMGQLDLQPTFPILFDSDSSALTRWQVRGLPTTIIVGPDGRLAYRAVGGREFDHPKLVKKLLALLP